MDYAWTNLTNYVLRCPAHYDIVVLKDSYIHPLQAGFVYSAGEPKSQLADYRMAVYGGKGLHILEYQNHYLVHWDLVDPSVDFVEHIKQDAPNWGPVLAAVGLAAVIGGLIWLGSEA